MAEQAQEELNELKDPHGDILYRVIECGKVPTSDDVAWLSDKCDRLAQQLEQAEQRIEELERDLAEWERHGTWLAAHPRPDELRATQETVVREDSDGG